jgi:hypothetical protein
MPYFRLYFINAVSGAYDGFEEFIAADDVEALRVVSPAAGVQAMELWCGSRKIQFYPAEAKFSLSEPRR